MKKLLMSLVLSVFLFFSCTSPTPSNDILIPFADYASNIPIVKAQVNGKDTYFIVDSGASTAVLDESTSKNFGFHFKPMDGVFTVGIGGTMPVNEVTDAKITIGGFEVQGETQCFNLSGLRNLIRQEKGIEIVGILGSNIFHDYHIIIDFEAGGLRIPK